MADKILFSIIFILLALPLGIWLKNTDLLIGPTVLLYQLSRLSALLGTVLLGLEFPLGLRFKAIENHFGQDKLVRYHHYLGIAAFILVFLHGFYFIVTFTTRVLDNLGLQLGVLALILFILMTAAIWIYQAGRSQFELWRFFHLLNYLIFPIAFYHSLLLGTGVKSSRLLQFEWFLLGLGFLVSLIHRITRSIRMLRNPYRISAVVQETHDIWRIKLEGKPFRFNPGQYLYLQLNVNGRASAEHPFTIASSPTEPILRLAIKASGDFTRELGRAHPGQTALIDGPYGRFSYLNYDQPDQELVFIAGGIGITPFLSMLGYLRAESSHRRIWLIWGNKTAVDIGFQEELAELGKGLDGLETIHVLSEGEPVNGETGFIDAAKIAKYVGDLTNKSFYICGPAIMMHKIIEGLRERHVSRDRIHYEHFFL